MSGALLAPEQERRAIELFEESLEQPTHKQHAFIDMATHEPVAVRNRARTLLSFAQSGDEQFVTGQAGLDFKEEGALPDRIGAYRILRLIGRGGMGNVYLAERASDDFDHVAAIKVIKGRLVNEDIADRFRRERQILAGLNHPHIAQLFDGGELADGAPFIVMEYIPGQPLNQWLEETSPEMMGRLKVFEQICDAVGFAHQHLVVHRDLTPANILITEAGRAKLIDFGIARTEGLDETSVSSTTGYTPGFAAPERQREGEVSILSDVYSLGRLLEFIAAPFLNEELKAIIKKATARDPAERYANAASLNADVSAYRLGQPVAAFGGSPLYVARKFASRQKLLVGATIGLGTALIGALISVSFAYAGQVAAQQQASERASQTRAIANNMMFEIYDEMSGIPGSTNARVMLADTAQEYLRSLAADPDATIEVLIEAGDGFRRLANIVGGWQNNAAGDPKKALQHLEESRLILQTALKQDPTNREAATALAQTLERSVIIKMAHSGDIKNAPEDTDKAIELLEANGPLSGEETAALVYAYTHKAALPMWDGDVERAIPRYGKAIDRLTGIPSEIRALNHVKRAEAELYLSYAGVQLRSVKEPKRAVAALEESVALRRAVLTQSNCAPDDAYKLVIALYYLAEAQMIGQMMSQATINADEALKLAREQRDINPASATQDTLFAGILMINALIEAELGRFGAATSKARESIELMRKRYQESPEIAASRMNFAVRLRQAGQVYDAVGQRSAACRAMREGAEFMTAYDRESGLPIGNKKNDLEPMQAYLTTC